MDEYKETYKEARAPIPVHYGVVVLKVLDGSPAHEAGLQMQDIIIVIGGQKVRETKDFMNWVKGAKIGQTYLANIRRPVYDRNGIRWERKIIRITPAPRKAVYRFATKTAGFRSAPWGSSRATVRDQEDGEPGIVQSDLLVYNGFVAELESLIAYIFVDDKLVRGKYQVIVEHSNENDFLVDYTTLKELLEEKYGKPDEDNVLWRNDLFQGDRQDWGLAVSIGHLVLSAQWTLEDTEITLVLRGDNSEIALVLEYNSRKYGSLETSKKKKAARDDL